MPYRTIEDKVDAKDKVKQKLEAKKKKKVKQKLLLPIHTHIWHMYVKQKKKERG